MSPNSSPEAWSTSGRIEPPHGPPGALRGSRPGHPSATP
eukprot:CAMPEP_0204042940 /NCGR_PEP_ID=MMETSP0360-20130528/99960_1 /ASSEMBLY_ACC=CAM_ASM_000342 /TAXON_ID=268821 /ORGANISM="Scrippsiella Hangoei, Strain SHTV-5" /LENGTH=38 /DNA_ID= /DNA_START= /DNA_END= /DNA_ORIENTATION=